MPTSAVPEVVRLLGTQTNVEILALLEEAPSYPRAIADRIGRSEGRVQKHLQELAHAGLVCGTWRHTDRTFKEYRIAVGGVHLRFEQGVSVDVDPVATR